MDHHDRRDHNPAIAGLLEDAYVVPVDVETAARHLWIIHSEARRIAEESHEAVDAALAETDSGRDALAAIGQTVHGARPGAAVPRCDVPRVHGRRARRVPRHAAPRHAARRVPRSAMLVMTLVFLMSFSGVAVAASQTSLPGDVLYPVKRGTERAQLIFTRDPFIRAELQLSFARARLDELNLIADSQPDRVVALVEEIAGTLGEVETSPPEVAAQVQPVSDGIRHDTSESIAHLRLPDDTRVAVATAMTAPPVAGASTASASAANPSVSATPTTSAPPESAAAASATPASSQEPSSDGQAVAAASPDNGIAVAPSGTETGRGPSEGAVVPSGGQGQTPGPAGEEASGAPTAPATGAPSTQPAPAGGTQPSPAGSVTNAPSPSVGSSQGPTPTPTPTPTVGPSTGPVVTARPQPTEGGQAGGSSRTEDDTEPATGSSAEPTTVPTEPAEPVVEPEPSDDAGVSGEPAPAPVAQPTPPIPPVFPEGEISRPSTDF